MNVSFINDDWHTVGLGTRGYGNIEFIDCEFICGNECAAVFMHDANDLRFAIDNQRLSFIHCYFSNNSDKYATFYAYSMEVMSQVASITFIGNKLINEGNAGLVHMTIFQDRPIIDGKGWMESSDWVLSLDSCMNNVDIMNMDILNYSSE